ncbi:MAG TPA: AMP-binding protein, partial [Pseudonocardiaceae bacterium]|nr:AMP-binding protein [Pseudonocardiaceae bacterium]
MALVSRLLTARAKERPDSSAFITGADGRALSWRELAGHGESWQAVARLRGLPARARIGVLIGDPLLFAAGYLGALAAGLTAVPLDPRLTESELAASLARLRVDVLVTDDPTAWAGVETWAMAHSGPLPVTRPSTTARPSAGAATRPA